MSHWIPREVSHRILHLISLSAVSIYHAFQQLQTFGIEGTQSISIEELCDGVVMSRALHQISPNFFSDAWMLKIKHDVGSNWRLKVSNLKKILQGVLDYYSEVLGQQLQDFIMPDISAIGEHSNREELSRLLQLILGCAINCETKEDYIQNIMSLEESVQHSVMNAIKELMSKGSATSPSDNDTAEQVRKLTEELADMTNQKEEIAHRCHELDLQVNALQEEKANLIADNERMNDRVNASDSMDDPSTPIGRRHQQLANQVEQLQEELYRLEAARDDYRLKVEIQSKEIQELNRKNENLNELADEARTLKDEMDELRHTQDKVEKYEANIETYKKKLEEMQDLKGQIKVLEEKNSGYMDTNMTLEEELRKCQSVRSQMEVYKRQMSDLQARCSEETRRADRAEFEAKRGSEKVSTLQREKERVTSERDSLREINEELRCTQVQKDTLLGEGNSQMFDDSNLDLSTLPTAVRERIIRLQHENKMLKQDRSEADQAEVLQTMLDDAQKRSNELQSEVRISNQRIMELEAQIEDFTESTEKSSASDQATVTNMRSKLNSAQQTINKQQEEMRERKQKMEEVESTLGDSESCVVQLRQQLFRKEEEMKGMEERYKRYLDKAKSVIQTLDPKNKSGPAPEVQALRNQLQEKERLIDHIEKDHEKAKLIREQEEKMMVSAWYNLGLKLHRQAAEDRLEKGHPARQSFLARQRQAHTKRTQAATSTQNSNANTNR